MSRPVPALALPPETRSWTPPQWDPEAVAADYLLALRGRAEEGAIDPEWLDSLLRHLALELSTAYTPDKAAAAVVGIAPLLEHWEAHAAAVAAGAMVDPISDLQPPQRSKPRIDEAIRDVLAILKVSRALAVRFVRRRLTKLTSTTVAPAAAANPGER